MEPGVSTTELLILLLQGYQNCCRLTTSQKRQGFGMIRPVLSDTRTLSPSSVNFHCTFVGFLVQPLRGYCPRPVGAEAVIFGHNHPGCHRQESGQPHGAAGGEQLASRWSLFLALCFRLALGGGSSCLGLSHIVELGLGLRLVAVHFKIPFCLCIFRPLG
ncbi:hypothetical protein EYF80_025962 [Liparis tanakae]|uniref:Uncharacterized protein n=1 Tax=Liparis tanakae TaxID=230148 RepID=A0A4Z2HDZ1_9TELE|nr:hypothetical protein EYF80_025962 [Liparis tanakae]